MSEDPKHIEQCRGVIKFLDNTIRNMAVYPPEHPSVKGVSRRVHEFLNGILQDKAEVGIGIMNGLLFVDDYIFEEKTAYSESVIKILNAFDIDEITVTREVTEEDVLKLARILQGSGHSRDAFLGKAQEEGLKHVGLKGVFTPREDDPVEEVVNCYRQAVITMCGFFEGIRNGKLPSLDEAQEITGLFLKKRDTETGTLLLMASLKGYERYTEQHCVNVCILAMLLAAKEGLEEKEIEWAALAGLLHDAGMAKVPAQVVEKSGSLTPAERDTYKSHPVHSAGIVHGMGGPVEVVMAVERHHIHFGGGGYPPGLEDEPVPLLADLLSVVDTYDAFTSVRPYKVPAGHAQAMDFLARGGGSRFDPVHVESFKSLLGPFPPGSVVRLSSNEIGVVTHKGVHPGHPVIKVFRDESGSPLEEAWELDIARDEVQGRVIAGLVDPALYGLTSEAVLEQNPA